LPLWQILRGSKRSDACACHYLHDAWVLTHPLKRIQYFESLYARMGCEEFRDRKFWMNNKEAYS
jgi:hypothetical protein